MKTNHKKFDAVKWVREVRDKFYEEHKNLKGKNYLNAIKNSIKLDDKIIKKHTKLHKKTENLA